MTVSGGPDPAVCEIYNDPYEYLGILSQDMLNKKVYFKLEGNDDFFPITFNGILSDTFVLMYDFDLEPYVSQVGHLPNMVFMEKDSIQLNNGTWRNRYYFGDMNTLDIDTSFYWTEELGGSLGFFTARMPSFVWDAGHRFRCYKAPSLLWNTVDELKCDNPKFVSLSDPDDAMNVKIFPNPIIDALNIKIPDEMLPATLRIFGLKGNLVKSNELVKSETSISARVLSRSGFYFLEIQGENGMRYYEKIIKAP